MKVLFTLILVCLVFPFLAHSQFIPGIEWQKAIGGGENDQLTSAQVCRDGGYLLGGYTKSDSSGNKTVNGFGGYDFWIVRMDIDGNILWQKSFGGIADEYLTAIDTTSDGGYLIGGYSGSGISGNKTLDIKGSYDFWILKLYADGTIEWQKDIGGTKVDELTEIHQTSEGGYILGGISDSGVTGDKTEPKQGDFDYWILKLDSDGNIEWQNTIGGNFDDVLTVIQQTNGGGYIVGGYSKSSLSGDKTEPLSGLSDYWVIKLDDSGNITWQNTIGGSGSEYFESIVQTNDNGYLIGGDSDSGISGDKTDADIGVNDWWIIKLNAFGVIEWQNTIGGSYIDNMQSMVQINTGNYLLAGSSISPVSGDKTEGVIGGGISYSDFWIVLIDTGGSVLWDNTIGGTIYDNAYTALNATDGGIFIAGTSSSNISFDKTEDAYGANPDFWVIKLACTPMTFFADDDADGYGTVDITTEACLKPSGFVTDSTDCDDSNPLIYPGAPEIADGLDNNCNDTIDEGLLAIPGTDVNSFLNIYPNPAQSNFIFNAQISSCISSASIEIYNTLGQSVYTCEVEIQSGFIQKEIQLPENMVPGIYQVILNTGSNKYVQELSVTKF